MKDAIDFYHKEVEPAFAKMSDLRNKKNRISHYLRNHDLPEDVRRSLIAKMDRLDRMIKTMSAPYRKKRHYYGILDKSIKQAVNEYIDGLSHDTMTVLENWISGSLRRVNP